MKKLAIITALPLALSIAACGDSVDGTDTADMEADTVEPMDQGMTETDDATMADPMTADQQAEVLDESAEDLEERADRVEDYDEAEADRLEAQAEAQQEQRDAID